MYWSFRETIFLSTKRDHQVIGDISSQVATYQEFILALLKNMEKTKNNANGLNNGKGKINVTKVNEELNGLMCKNMNISPRYNFCIVRYY